MYKKSKEEKFRTNGQLIMSPGEKRRMNNFQRYQYQINEFTDIRNKNLDNSLSNKSFINGITVINSTNLDLLNDLKNGKKNMEILVKNLNNLKSEGNNELINITNEISEKIKDLYKFLINNINNQNEENYKLKLELNKALKENDFLRNQVNYLTNEILKLEQINIYKSKNI